MNGSVDFSTMPWWVGLLAMLISAVSSYLAARISSKSKGQTDLIAQTVERQRQLDERYTKLTDDLQEESKRLRDEMQLLRTDLANEKLKNESLEKAMKTLEAENVKFREENQELRNQVENLKNALQKFEREKCNN